MSVARTNVLAEIFTRPWRLCRELHPSFSVTKRRFRKGTDLVRLSSRLPRVSGPRGLRPHRNRQGNPSTPSDSGHAGSARRYGHTDAIKGLACSAGLGGARVALLLPDVDQRCLQWRRRDFDQSRERLVHLDYEKHGATD